MGFVDGVRLPAEVYDMYKHLELAQLMGNHDKISTTREHYSELEEKVLAAIYSNMNLGLTALRQFKAKQAGVMLPEEDRKCLME